MPFFRMFYTYDQPNMSIKTYLYSKHCQYILGKQKTSINNTNMFILFAMRRLYGENER